MAVIEMRRSTAGSFVRVPFFDFHRDRLETAYPGENQKREYQPDEAYRG
jgi:hypothetical protein